MGFRLASLGAFAAVAGLATNAPATPVCDPNQPLSGAALFAEHCASCHGVDATGGQTPTHVAAPDLTVLARKAHGKYPAPHVADVIRYGGALPDHSITKQMPIWAEIFHAECGPVYSRRVVVELMKFLQDKQK